MSGDGDANPDNVSDPDDLVPERKPTCEEIRVVGLRENVDTTSSTDSFTSLELKCNPELLQPKCSQHNGHKKKHRIRLSALQSAKSLPKPPTYPVRNCTSMISVKHYNLNAESEYYSKKFVCSLYITDLSNSARTTSLDSKSFGNSLKSIINGKIKTRQTLCGFLVGFTELEDADRVLRLPLKNIFGVPVEVTRFPTGEATYRKYVIIKDVPWSLSYQEIYNALKVQGISAGEMLRHRSVVKVEILNALDAHKLTEEGLNFYDFTTFAVFIDKGCEFHRGDDGVVQCFRCQGFGHTAPHCRFAPRCVRCGENHAVEYCEKSRDKPVCCHCKGAHHAAYRFCPKRISFMNSTQVEFTLSKFKPWSFQ